MKHFARQSRQQWLAAGKHGVSAGHHQAHAAIPRPRGATGHGGVEGVDTVLGQPGRNGFHVVGESAAASPENFDAEIGRKIARDNARNKIWALEGYLLRSRLAAAA